MLGVGVQSGQRNLPFRRASSVESSCSIRFRNTKNSGGGGRKKMKYHLRKGVKFHFNAKNSSFQFSGIFHVSRERAEGRSHVRCPVQMYFPGQNCLVPLQSKTWWKLLQFPPRPHHVLQRGRRWAVPVSPRHQTAALRGIFRWKSGFGAKGYLRLGFQGKSWYFLLEKWKTGKVKKKEGCFWPPSLQ